MDILKTRTISAQLAKDDFRLLSNAMGRRAVASLGWTARLEPLAAGAVAFAAVFWFAQFLAQTLVESAFYGMVAAIVAASWSIGRVRETTLKRVLRADGAFLRPFRISADQEGVTLQSDVAETRLRWPAIFAIEVSNSLILIFIDRANAFAVPRSAFVDDAGMNAFADELRFLKRRSTETRTKKGAA